MRGLVRIAVTAPALALGNPMENAGRTLAMLKTAAERGASVAVCPELNITGATCGDLFFQDTLLDAAERALLKLRDGCPEGLVAAVGSPLKIGGGLYDCAVVIKHGEFVCVVPKTYLNSGEKAWFRSAEELTEGAAARIGGEEVPAGRPVLESADGVKFGIEIGADLQAAVTPGTLLALSGAEVLLNLSASAETVTARAYRQELIRATSKRLLCGYVYASAGSGESTGDCVYAGHAAAASCGEVLKENDETVTESALILADIDIDRIRSERVRHAGFGDSVMHWGDPCPECVPCGADLYLDDAAEPDLEINKLPFIPSDKASRKERCGRIFDLMASGLARRLGVTGGRVVIGISGGLDSTLALLAACRSMDLMGLPRTNILGITMPCFGTSDQTYNNALALMESLGITRREIPIHEAVRQHFKDIGHDESDHSVVYENAQARERTQILMDVANQFGGIVLGTGDLSEIALGWCTYNADHMSMYNVNCGVPKTLIRWIIGIIAEDEGFAASREVLLRILDTPISPELLPPDAEGKIAQQTEDLVGPYALHDFFLYYAVRFGYSPKKIYELCCIAFKNDFDKEIILKWLKNFYKRLFTQQFKRNCSADGVKIGSVSLSPRGDWRMPSDAQSAAWLRECEEL